MKLLRNKAAALAWCIAGFLFSISGVAGADDGLANRAEALRVWRVANGLPADSVTAILQTRDGFLWIGTSGGLAWFDGVKFTSVDFSGATTNRPVRITALCEDSPGHLWIGTQGSGVFELAEGSLRHFDRGRGLLDDDVTSLAADSHGQVWIGCKSGLNLWTNGGFEGFTTRDGLPDQFVSNVNVARSGTVWITTRVGMCRFLGGRIVPYAFQTESQGRSPEYLGAYEDRRGNLWAFGDTYLINLAEGKRFNYFRGSESASVRIWSLWEGRDGRLWIGTSGRGLFCFEANRFVPVMLGGEHSPYDVRAICDDDQGDLWLGTADGGLVQLRLQMVHILRPGQGLPDSPPTSLAVDPSGQVYVGLQRGGLFVGASGRFDRVDSSLQLPLQHFISSVWGAPDGTIWAGTLGDGLVALRNGRMIHFSTADGLANNAVQSVCVDHSGAVWAAASRVVQTRGQYGFDRVGNPLPGAVTAMIPAGADGVWVGTQDGEVLLAQKKDPRLAPKIPRFLPAAVIALHQGRDGLWMGTRGAGLYCLAGGSLMNWTTNDGLPGNIVAGVAEDAGNNLWVATDAGIYRVEEADVSRAVKDPSLPLACRWLSAARALPDAAGTAAGNRVVLAPDGELWFATADGVLNVDARATEILPSRFPVSLESIAFNGQPPISLLRGEPWSAPGAAGNPARAPDDLRSVEVNFTAIDFAAPEEVRFRHKLEGFDPEWVEDGAGRSARYGRLPYGVYRIQVSARTEDGPWRDATQDFAFVVPTPLYYRAWAIFLYGLLAVGAVAGIVRAVSHRRLRTALARLEQQQVLERERMRIARDMHDEMGSKLTKISFLSERAQVTAGAGPLARSVESIAEASRELLKTMDEIVWVVNPRNDTLENLTAYLGHYAMEYFQNTNIECELRLPAEIPNQPLSSESRHNLFLTFEEALNNILKHSGATRVKVEMALADAEFLLKITDNGRGFDATAEANPARGGRGGNGLTNMRQRLAAIGGECDIAGQPGQGAAVTLRIRLNHRNSHAL